MSTEKIEPKDIKKGNKPKEPEKKPEVDDGTGMDSAKKRAKGGGDSGAAGGTPYEQAMAAVDSISQDDEEIGLQAMWKWLQSSTPPVEGAPEQEKSQENESLDDTSRAKKGPSP